jgi:hypothetical protein
MSRFSHADSNRLSPLQLLDSSSYYTMAMGANGQLVRVSDDIDAGYRRLAGRVCEYIDRFRSAAANDVKAFTAVYKHGLEPALVLRADFNSLMQRLVTILHK